MATGELTPATGPVVRPRQPRLSWWRAARVPLAMAAPVVAATAYVAAVDPNRPGHYPACPVLSLFGVYCPGCGGLRAVHALTHGHPLQALNLNAFAVLFLTVTVAVWAGWLWSRIAGRALPHRLIPALLTPLVVLLPVFTIVRNLPVGHLLAP